MSGNYDDIIHLPRPISNTRARMSPADRAAQFSPFAALTGYEDAIEETGRLTNRREEISDNRSTELDAAFHLLLERLDTCPQVKLVRFLEDGRKEGGEYVTQIVHIRKADLYRRELWSVEGERIFMDDIWELSIL